MATHWTLGCDANDPHLVADFWALALGYVNEPGFDGPDGASIIDPDGVGPAIGFGKVPEGKTAKNRMHIDVSVAGEPPWNMVERGALIRAKVAVLAAAGGTIVREEFYDEHLGHIVMFDPEGNEILRRLINLPELVQQRAISNGVAGQRWLDALPAVVARLTAKWGLELGASFSGGTAGFVARATDKSGRDCVLKVAMPLDMDEVESFHRSVLVHQLAGGRGCAELYDHDDDAPAMLLELLGPNLAEMALPLPGMLRAIATTLQSFWRPAIEDNGLPTGVDKAAWLARYIESTWAELGQPCDRAVIDRAVQYCDDRAAAFDPAQAVLNHGDAHGWNTVAVGDGSFKFVDPEGLRSERAHDLSVPMREYNEPLLDGNTKRLVQDRAELLASWCEVDPEPVMQWGFIERVSTGLANARDFGAEAGAIYLEVARRCL